MTRWLLILTAALALLLAMGCPTDDDDDVADDDATDDDDDDDVTGDDDSADDDDDDTTGSTEDLDGDGFSPAQGDCDDENPEVNPDAEEVPYDGIDNDCADGDLMDVDGDGFEPVWFGGDDCDDEDAAINPDAEEVCGDGIDHDCSGDPDDGSTDADGDGYVDWACTGGDDCDDGSAVTAPDRTVYVPDDYASVVDAVAEVCTGSTVHVAAGTYTGDVDAEGKSLTLVGDDGAATTFLQGSGADSVVTIGGGGEATSVSGFTVSGGDAMYGGGVHCTGQCTLSGMVFTGNHGYFGGGLALVDADIDLSDLEFTSNTAEWGAGFYAEYSTGAVDALDLTDNDSVDGGGAATIRHSTMDMNALVVSGGQASAGQGGGLHLHDYQGTLSNTSIAGVYGQIGGALLFRDSVLDLVDNTFSGNHTSWGGAGFYCWDSAVTSVQTNEVTGNTTDGCDDYVPRPCNNTACRSCSGC